MVTALVQALLSLKSTLESSVGPCRMLLLVVQRKIEAVEDAWDREWYKALLCGLRSDKYRAVDREFHAAKFWFEYQYWINEVITIVQWVQLTALRLLLTVAKTGWSGGHRLVIMTWPWNMKIALMVLWGVCWMFHGSPSFQTDASERNGLEVDFDYNFLEGGDWQDFGKTSLLFYRRNPVNSLSCRFKHDSRSV